MILSRMSISTGGNGGGWWKLWREGDGGGFPFLGGGFYVFHAKRGRPIISADRSEFFVSQFPNKLQDLTGKLLRGLSFYFAHF
jgi:hypothetical protein